MAFGTILVAQGGGPSAVIDQRLAGVVQAARFVADLKAMQYSMWGGSGTVVPDAFRRYPRPLPGWGLPDAVGLRLNPLLQVAGSGGRRGRPAVWSLS